MGITIDVMDKAKDVDTVVLLSGDGDFDLLLEKVQRDYSVCAEVYGVRSLAANSLIDSANVYHCKPASTLEGVKDDIASEANGKDK